jgi:hypothetical protein
VPGGADLEKPIRHAVICQWPWIIEPVAGNCRWALASEWYGVRTILALSSVHGHPSFAQKEWAHHRVMSTVVNTLCPTAALSTDVWRNASSYSKRDSPYNGLDGGRPCGTFKGIVCLTPCLRSGGRCRTFSGKTSWNSLSMSAIGELINSPYKGRNGDIRTGRQIG